MAMLIQTTFLCPNSICMSEEWQSSEWKYELLKLKREAQKNKFQRQL